MAKKTTPNGLTEYAQFKGLSNTVAPEYLAADDLTLARNVDVNDVGHILRRRGHSAPVSEDSFSSLYSDGTTCIAVRDGTALVRILPDLSIQTLRTDLTAGLLVSSTTIGARVYYSNGAETGCVENGQNRSWGLEPPPAQPAAEAVSGTLRAGRYQYAVTYLRADGQESGSQRAQTFELAADGGIRLSDLPSLVSGAELYGIYFSKWNGEVLYRAAVLPVGATSFTLSDEFDGAVMLRTQHLRPAPAGHIVEAFGGWALVASGDTLYPSEPHSPELFDLRRGIRMAAPITFVAPLDSGVYVGTDTQVVWLAGDSPAKWQYNPRLSYGAVRGAVA